MERRPLRLAIVGGGIGGLTLALTLSKLIPSHRRHVKIDIYESTTSLKTQVGAGIAVWPIIWGIFEDLDLVDDLNKFTIFSQTDDPVEMIQVRQGDIHPGRNLFRLTTTSGRIVVLHRGDFQGMLLSHLPDSVNIHTNKRLDTYTQKDDGVTLQFEDGTTAVADVLIGADGLQSRVRRKMVEEMYSIPSDIKAGEHPADARWSGVVAYRGLVLKEKILEQGFTNHRALHDVTLYFGEGAALMCYPVSNGADVNFVGVRNFPQHEGTRFSEEAMEKILRAEGFERPQSVEVKVVPVHGNVATGDIWSENFKGTARADGKRARWFTRVSPEEVKHVYRGWEPEVQALANGLGPAICWAVHTVEGLKAYCHKKVCVLGDAAHSMRPQHETGAVTAIYDAYLLGSLFVSAVASDPSELSAKTQDILQVYDQIRRPFMDDVMARAKLSAHHYNRKVQEGALAENVQRTIDTTVEEDVKLLQDQLTDSWSYAWDKQSVPRSVKLAVQMVQSLGYTRRANIEQNRWSRL